MKIVDLYRVRLAGRHDEFIVRIAVNISGRDTRNILQQREGRELGAEHIFPVPIRVAEDTNNAFAVVAESAHNNEPAVGPAGSSKPGNR
jgi:hypothetical protein